jgi:hypothetical protein
MIFWLSFLMLFLVSCGDDGNNDTVLTGFSGVLIFGIIAYVIYRVVKGKTGGSK